MTACNSWQGHQTKPTPPNPQSQATQTKPAKPNLPNQTKLSQPSLLNQSFQTKPTKPNQNNCVRSAFGNVCLLKRTPACTAPLVVTQSSCKWDENNFVFQQIYFLAKAYHIHRLFLSNSKINLFPQAINNFQASTTQHYMNLEEATNKILYNTFRF